MKILSCNYRSYEEDPIIDIWGIGGERKTYFGFKPYFIAQFNQHISEEVALKLLRSKGFYDIETIYRYMPIGYQNKKSMMFKITLHHPNQIRYSRDIVSHIPNIFKVYEADILFVSRFLIDHGWGGFSEIGENDNKELSYVGFDIECLPPGTGKMPDSAVDPVIIISMSFSPKWSETDRLIITDKKTGYEGCPVILCKNEKDIIQTFIDVIKDCNPDVIAGYNSNAFDFTYLDRRCKVLRLSPNIGRDGRNWYVRNRFDGGVDVTVVGRVIVDLLPIIRKSYSLNQYTLREVAKLVKHEKLDMKPMEMREAYLNEGNIRRRSSKDISTAEDDKRNNVEGLRSRSETNSKISHIIDINWDSVIAYADRDAELVMKLMLDLKIVDKYAALSKASGLLLQDVINSGQSQMIEALLMRKFRENNRVMAMRPEIDEEEEDEIRYEGASVMSPPKGLQKNLAILDFRSLYPTIVIAHNISYDTLLQNDEKDVEYEVSPSGAKFVKSSVQNGIMPEILNTLLNKRIETKKLMKQATGAERDFLDAEQYSYKILLNSFYGYAGYLRARLFTIEVAESVTAYGRTTIESTIKLIRDMGYNVVYSDTDSTMVEIKNFNSLDEMKIIAEDIAKKASEPLPQPMELIFEAIAKTAIFLTKKRYAMWRFEPTRDGWSDKLKTKGIATVRRDWCKMTGDNLRFALDSILIKGDVITAAKHSHESVMRIKMMDITKSQEYIDDLVLTRRYGGDLSKYKTDPVHIKLIKRMIARGEQEPSTGDRIPFIIINEYSGTFSNKGEDPEYASAHKYTIDIEYYIHRQILPPLEDIFDPFGITLDMLQKGIYERVDKRSKQKSLFDL